jgi:hypothetical protein
MTTRGEQGINFSKAIATASLDGPARDAALRPAGRDEGTAARRERRDRVSCICAIGHILSPMIVIGRASSNDSSIQLLAKRLCPIITLSHDRTSN